MNATQQIHEALKGIMPDNEANACNIWKGYDVGTGETGWHYQRFGQTATFIGANLDEALATIGDIAQEQADQHAEAMRGMRGPGRPKLDASDPTERFTVTLPNSIAVKAARLGNGNMSAGVRQAIETAGEPAKEG